MNTTGTVGAFLESVNRMEEDSPSKGVSSSCPKDSLDIKRLEAKSSMPLPCPLLREHEGTDVAIYLGNQAAAPLTSHMDLLSPTL